MSEVDMEYHDTSKQTNVVCEVVPAPDDRIILIVDHPIDNEIRAYIRAAFEAEWESGKPLIFESGIRLTFIRGTASCVRSETDQNSG